MLVREVTAVGVSSGIDGTPHEKLVTTSGCRIKSSKRLFFFHGGEDSFTYIVRRKIFGMSRTWRLIGNEGLLFSQVTNEGMRGHGLP